MKKRVLIFILICLNMSAYSKTISGSGEGFTENAAKEAALRSLSEQIKVEVKSSFSKRESVEGDNYSSEKSSSIDLESKNRVLGAEIMSFNLGVKGYRVEAILDESSIPLYEKELEELKKEIEIMIGKLGEYESVVKRRGAFLDILEKYKEYDEYTTILLLLGSEKSYKLAVSKAEIKIEVKKLEEVLNSDKVIWIEFDEGLQSDDKKVIESEVKNILSEISKNNRTISFGKNRKESNLIIKVGISSKNVEDNPPVYYNNTKITDEFYSAKITLNFDFYFTVINQSLTKGVVGGEAKDFYNREKAYRSAVKEAISNNGELLFEDVFNKKY